jgi:hypothetical protein
VVSNSVGRVPKRLGPTIAHTTPSLKVPGAEPLLSAITGQVVWDTMLGRVCV